MILHPFVNISKFYLQMEGAVNLWKWISYFSVSTTGRRHGSFGSPASSPGQAPKFDHMRPKMENWASSPRQAPKIDHMQPKMEALTISPRRAPKGDDIRSRMENLRR